MFPGDPEAAYRATFELDFVDSPMARDFCSALNAGLAAALSPKLDSTINSERWSALLGAMTNTDPFRMKEIPFAGRPLDKWLSLAKKLADEAGGSPAELFRRLEDDGKPVYWWDAYFTLLVPLSVLHFCKFDPLASMHLCLDFGHDTDSYAQVLGRWSARFTAPTFFQTQCERTY